MKCVVIGAGINGLSTAIWLQRFGHDVTLIDRAEPGSGTSYGNAGILAAGAVLPVTVPGLIAKIPKMVLSKKSPLFLRWRYVPRLLPFLLKYLSHVRYDDMKVWHGFRPTTANSYPVIGRPAHLSNAHVGFGHQHIGLTAGPKTGRILAEMISNRPVNKDLSVFDPNQYLAVSVEVS